MDQANGKRPQPPGWLDAAEAADRLGVKRQTLYAYASRGLIQSAPAAKGRGRRYARADVERLVARRDARAGHGPAAAGALRWGEPVLDSTITRIGPEGPVYRGHPATALAADGRTFEAVAELLWFQRPPAPLEAPWPGVDLGVDASALRSLLPDGASPLDAMTVAVAALGAADESRYDAGDPGRPRRLLPRLAAAAGLRRGRTRDALVAGPVARILLTALGGRTSPAAERLLNEALILVADHELNPSTFAARIPASVGASDEACVGAALAALSGPRHGGMTARVEALLAEIGGPEDAVRGVRQRLHRGEDLPGFGHPLYPDGDPRGAHLLAAARRVAPKNLGTRTLFAIADAVSLAGHQPPTLDVGLVAVASALRLGPGGALAVFAAGRAAGWLAHAREQREAGFPLRPRARYVGAG